MLIDALADQWDVNDTATGKQLWFRLAATRVPRDRVACTCGAGSSSDGSASLQLAAGVALAVVSKRLGHSTIALTADT